MMFDLNTVNNFSTNVDIYQSLENYCKILANKYNQTNEGKYRIKYNDLYAFLYNSLSDEKKVEFFNSFATSLDIYPFIININSIELKMI